MKLEISPLTHTCGNVASTTSFKTNVSALTVRTGTVSVAGDGMRYSHFFVIPAEAGIQDFANETFHATVVGQYFINRCITNRWIPASAGMTDH
jgi:hypothetical protein